MGKLLAGITFDTVYSSPLGRAVDTGENCVPRERSANPGRAPAGNPGWGIWRGLTWEEIVRQYPQSSTFMADPAAYVPPPNGEPLQEMIARIDDFLCDLAERLPPCVDTDTWLCAARLLRLYDRPYRGRHRLGRPVTEIARLYHIASKSSYMSGLRSFRKAGVILLWFPQPKTERGVWECLMQSHFGRRLTHSLFDVGELLENMRAGKSWRTKRGTFRDTHPGNIHHEHAFERIVDRKP